MDNRVYFGEYTLKHWIELLANKNIILPEFQRSFVWNKIQVEKYITALQEHQFIPPVTIGKYQDGTDSVNIIVDGQQRLTSLLLAYLKKYPKKERFSAEIDTLESGTDNTDDEDSSDRRCWSLNKLTDLGYGIDMISSSIHPDDYQELSTTIDEEFFNNTFLGFSYLVPSDNYKKYYAKVFNSINSQGTSLSPLESRRSLYFMEENLKDLFDPEWIKEYKVVRTAHKARLDFVRYLSTSLDYDGATDQSKMVAYGYSKNIEEYYINFIEQTVSEYQDTNSNNRYHKVFGDGKYNQHQEVLKQLLSEFDFPKEYPSIIDMDMHFFGLVYWCIIKGKTFLSENKDDLFTEIRNKIQEYKSDSKHSDGPNKLKFLNKRMSDSISIYREYAQ